MPSGGDPTYCTVDGCDRNARARGLCASHYNTRRCAGKLPERIRVTTHWCKVPDCGTEHYAKGFCKLHYIRYKKGDLKEELPPRRKGQGSQNADGYVELYRPHHPNASRNGMILEHRLVMSEHLGRPLRPHENAHHKNGNRQDNRIDNLELWSTFQPSGQRIQDKVAYAVEILTMYAPETLART